MVGPSETRAPTTVTLEIRFMGSET
jgi:hypothetical protein